MKIPEIVFTNYKEPLKEVPGGHGYLGTLGIRSDNGKLQCHICGKCFDSLGNHVHRVHSLKAKMYKDKFKLAGSTRLVSDKIRLKLSKSSNLNGKNSLKLSALAKRKARKNTVTANKRRSGKRESLEARNRKGSCPDQLIQKIIDLRQKIKKVPSVKEFRKEYGSTFSYNLYQTFGSYPNAIRFAGLKWENRKKGNKYSDAELLEYLVNFYKKYDRTPRETDMRTHKMPDRQTYAKRFGSLNKARFLSGVPVLEGKGVYAKEVLKTKDFDLI